MAAHWVSAKFTGYDDEGRAKIEYEAADLAGSFTYYVGIEEDCNYLTAPKGTAISPGSPKGTVMLSPSYAGKTITLNLCGGMIFPSTVMDTISVFVGITTQNILLQDSATNEPITGATVTVDGRSCTEVDGLYSIEIGEGIEARVEVKAEGYTDKTDTFTTGIATFFIKLVPEIPPAEGTAHWVSAKFTGYDDEGRAKIEYEAADLEPGLDFYAAFSVEGLYSIKGTNITATSPVGSIMLPPGYAGKTVTLYLLSIFTQYDSISVYIEPPPEIPPEVPPLEPPEPEEVLIYSDSDRKCCDSTSTARWPLNRSYFITRIRIVAGDPIQRQIIKIAKDGVVVHSGYLTCLGKFGAYTRFWEIYPNKVFSAGLYTLKSRYGYLCQTCRRPQNAHVWVYGILSEPEIPPEVADLGELLLSKENFTLTISGVRGWKYATFNPDISLTPPYTVVCDFDFPLVDIWWTSVFITLGESSYRGFRRNCTAWQAFKDNPRYAPPSQSRNYTCGDIEYACSALPLASHLTKVYNKAGTPRVTFMTGDPGTKTVHINSFKIYAGEVVSPPPLPEIPPEIPPEEELITQLISVTKAGPYQEEFITGATVTVNGKACEGLPDGLYSIEIEEGIEATVTANATGYKSKTETFTTTSIATLMIALEKTEIPIGDPQWDYVEFDTWVDDSNKARIKYKGLDLTSGTEYHGVFEVMLPPEIRIGTEINTATLSGYVDIDATMNEGKTVEIRLYEYASGKPNIIVDRKDVAIPMRPEIDQVEVILGPEMLALWQANPTRVVHCDELIDYAWPFLAWFPPMFGLEVRKNVTDGKAIFTAADGLVKGKEYIFHMYPQLALEEVLKGNAVKFGYTPSVTLTKTNIMEAVMCPFFGFDPASVECENEVNEFVDAYYVANTIKKLVKGENLLGEPDTADAFDIMFMPIIMLGAAVPFFPVGATLKKALGPIVNLIRKADKGAWLAKNQHKMHLALAAGKGASIDEAKKLMALGKWDEAEKLLDNVVTEIHSSPTLSATARENLAGWNAGARKLLDDNPQMKTKIDDLTDEVVDGTIFKTHFDEIIRHFDEAAMAGDWTKAKQIWKDGVAGSTDNLVYFDMNLAKASPNFQRMHNIMRFSKIDYVNALAEANRLSPDLDFMARHLTEAGEPYNYITVWKALDATEQAHVVSNIGQTGRKDIAKIIDLLGADTSKGTAVHASSVTKKLDDLGEMTEDEVRATNNIVGAEVEKAAKTATSTETEAAAKMVTSDDAVKHPKMARLWAYVHRHPKTAKLMEETGTTSFKKLPLWAKASVIGVVFMGVSTVWKTMMDFCMALFMGEETIQWAGFGGIVMNSMTYDWDEKSLSERNELIAAFEEFRELRGKIHDTVTTASGVFETLCFVFGHIYKNFWEADKVSLWALDQKIADMKKGIDPLSGIGECTLLAAADKKGVAFYVHGESKKYHSGAAYDVVHVKDVLVRDEEYKVVLCAEKEGYVLGIQQIRITRDDIGEKISTPTFELIPDSDIGVNPFSGLPYTDEEYNALAQKPTKYGKIICSTNPTGAKIYLDGVYKDVDTNWTLDYVPVGTHKITFKLEGYFDCEKVVNVVIEPHAQAFCYLETAEGSIRCKRMDIDHYKDRAADLFYKKHADVDWIRNPQSAPTDGGVEYIEDLEVGEVYDVKYNFLDVLECINGEVLTIPPNVPVDCDDCQLASRLPREITTTVTEVIDGDSFRTVYTDALPRRPYGSELVPQEVRIIGCNAYEIGSPIGRVAKAKLTELIGGKSVTLKIDTNRPLGVYNRLIAGVFLPDGTDVAIKMMEACVIREYPGDTAKYRYAYYWEPWLYLDAVWARYDPEGNNCIASQDATGKTLVSLDVDTATKTFKINNRWLPVYAVVRKYKKAEHVGTADEYASKAILTGATSSSYGYYDATDIRLFASVDPITIKNQGVEIESVIISDLVGTYVVTFTSDPATATMLVTPKELALSRLTSVLRTHRESTPISRFVKKQKFK